MNKKYKYDICIIGGAGHIGLPLGLLFKEKNKKVVLYDVNLINLKLIDDKKMPFYEKGAQKLLSTGIDTSSDFDIIKSSKNIIVCIGTPVDEYLNPKFENFFNLFYNLKEILKKNQTIIIRSSVYPKTCQRLAEIVNNNIAYCPERIVQGSSISEMAKLPQIVSGFSKTAINNSSKLFRLISKKIIITTVLEAELIKLFSNSWRYVNFAVSNQFFMIASNLDINYSRLRKLMIDGYERNKSIPMAGFAAGPCLLKDTMQLTSFTENNFNLGHNAMLINEGLPSFIVENLKKKCDIRNKKVGILGLTFKSNVDDIRDSLSFKLIKILKFNGCEVLVSDEFYKHNDHISKNKLINNSEIIILAVPHDSYKSCKIPKSKILIDTWGFFEK